MHPLLKLSVITSETNTNHPRASSLAYFVVNLSMLRLAGTVIPFLNIRHERDSH